MMTPINRIPLEDMTESKMINSEALPIGMTEIELGDMLTELIDHTGDQNHLSITLDWAMQLRERTGHDWGTCIRVAMIAYFG